MCEARDFGYELGTLFACCRAPALVWPGRRRRGASESTTWLLTVRVSGKMREARDFGYELGTLFACCRAPALVWPGRRRRGASESTTWLLTVRVSGKMCEARDFGYELGTLFACCRAPALVWPGRRRRGASESTTWLLTVRVSGKMCEARDFGYELGTLFACCRAPALVWPGRRRRGASESTTWLLTVRVSGKMCEARDFGYELGTLFACCRAPALVWPGRRRRGASESTTWLLTVRVSGKMCEARDFGYELGTLFACCRAPALVWPGRRRRGASESMTWLLTVRVSGKMCEARDFGYELGTLFACCRAPALVWPGRRRRGASESTTWLFTVRVTGKMCEARDFGNEPKFLKKEKSWLARSVVLHPYKAHGQGRPKTEDVKSLTKRGQNQRAAKIIASLPAPASAADLALAAGLKFSREGQLAAAKSIKNLATAGSTEGSSIGLGVTRASAVEAAGLVASGDFTKEQYLKIRFFCKKHGADVFPPYNDVLEEKKKTYPPSETLSATPAKISVPLQSLLDITTQRLLMLPDIDVGDFPTELVLISKAGFDGSSAHKVYKQYSTENSDSLSSSTTVVFTGLVPVRLTNSSKSVVFHQIERCNSSSSCRPIKVEHTRETNDFISLEWADLQSQCSKLVPTVIKKENKNISVSHEVCWTMFDGKVKANLTGSSAMTCNFCKRSPKYLNVLEDIDTRPINEEALKFGLSPLHSLICFFNCLIKLGSKLALEDPTWQVKGKERQNIVEARKREIQRKMRDEMGLLVDVPLAGGVGNSTDGNTARRAFDKPAKFAAILGVSEDLVTRFSQVLSTLRCSQTVDVDKFKKFSFETAELFVKLYGDWCYMPCTVHEVLLHGWRVMKYLPVPTGLLSEEALESRNKHIRAYRLKHTRKFSGVACTTDLFNRLMFTSDPVMQSYSALPKKQSRSVSLGDFDGTSSSDAEE
ncbi:Serpin B10 [Frankliniella fusca]|uniref:Serpin B10 n=1 Tax=Frankliniella fusca TaxID=407009 RepID=A0AAE1HPQ8_9NEOP|nr:Serpin B10 [Frankliniella fusca]